MIYKLPLDDDIDKDVIDWIEGMPRSKKAEVVRHALRYYISQLEDGEIFIMPSSTPSSNDISNKVVKKPVGIRKEPKKGLGDMIKGSE